MSFTLRDEFRDLVDRADVGEHRQRGFVGAAMRRAPQAGDAGGDTGERVGAGGAGDTHRRGRGVLLVVGVQDEDLVERVSQHRIDLVVLARHREAHVQEVLGKRERVLRIHEGLADGVFEGHRRQRRDLRDHAHRGDHALLRIVDVGGVVIERGERADGGDHDGHRMGVAAKTLEEAGHLLVNHGVVDHAAVEILLLRRGRKLPVEQEIAGLEEVALLGELLDRIAAVFQHAGVAVDIGDLGLAAAGRGEAGVVGEHPGLGVELGDVDHIGPNRAAQDREIVGLVADRKGRRLVAGFCVHRVVPDEIVAKTGLLAKPFSGR